MVRRRTKTYVGKPCKHGHVIPGTNTTLRYKSNGGCVTCSDLKGLTKKFGRVAQVQEEPIELEFSSETVVVQEHAEQTHSIQISDDVLALAAEIDRIIKAAVTVSIANERERIKEHFSSVLA